MHQPAVSILGDVEVAGPDRIVALGATNMSALLCLLAFTPGRAVPNDRLIGALWPDADVRHGRRSLISLVHQLNSTIDPLLGSDRSVRTVKGVGRALRVDPAAIDAVRFERGVASGEAHVAAGRLGIAIDELTAALRLWRGPPFGGLDLPILIEPQAQLATTRARAETTLIESALRLGRGDELLDLLQPRLDLNPEDEQVVAAMARALHQSGRPDEAVAVVQRCIDRLRQRGIEPTPALRRLVERLESSEAAGLGDQLEPTTGDDRGGWDHGRLAMRPTRSPGQSVALIGRHVERAGIGNWFVGATAPRSIGRALVLAGEPGIGKSAVLDTWMNGMSDRIVGVRTRCSPEQILPFEAFAPLLPTRRPASFDDEVQTRQQLFDGVLSRLRALSDGRPLVLAIDDAHWLTASSVSLLEHLVGSEKLGELRVVLSLRHHEALTNEPLRRLLDDWRSRRSVETLVIGPLSDDEIGELAARHRLPDRRTAADPGTAADRRPTQSTLRAPGLRALTGGNPLFVIQLAQTGAAGADGADVPATIEHLLGRYLDGLSSTVLRSIETAALLGPRGSLSQLARCTGRDELVEIAALDTVGEGRLMFVRPIDGSYRFVHELARQTVMANIPPGRAMRVHLGIADGLETESHPDPFAVAHHLRLAVPAARPERAATALLAAARRARELGDFETSHDLAEQALGLTRESAARADALVLMASGAQSFGDREQAARNIAEAVDLALQSNATAVLARALFVKAVVMCFWGSDDLAVRIEAAVIELLRERASSADADTDVELVELIWAVCLDHPGRELPARRALAERALRIARDGTDEVATMRALHASQLVGQMILTEPQVVIDWGGEALELTASTHHPMMAIQIRMQIVTALLRAGRTAAAIALHDELATIEREVADLAFRWTMRASSASLALTGDDLDRAERLVLEARDIGEPLAGSRPAEEYINHMGVLQLARGSLPGLHHLFGAWVDQPPGPVWHWAIAAGELIDDTDPQSIERRAVLTKSSGNAVPPHSEWLAELTIAAEYASRSDDAELGELLTRCIHPFVDQFAVFGIGLSLGSMWRPYALALAAAGDHGAARAAMATARSANADAGLPLWQRLSNLYGRAGE